MTALLRKFKRWAATTTLLTAPLCDPFTDTMEYA
jgi:hypothetical protein